MKRKLLFILTLILLLSLSGCGKGSKVYPLEPDEDQRDIAVSDMLGGQLRLEVAAQRLVVLSPSACEIIADLGETQRIVARGELCTYPKEVSDILVISSQELFNPKIMEDLKSDLIIIDSSYLSIKEVNSLYKEGMAVLLLDVKNVEDIYRSTEIIGKVLGKNLAAKELVRYMSDQWEELLKRSKEGRKGSIYIENTQSPTIGFGRNSLISYFLENLGYENASKYKESRSFTLGEVELLDPDFILILGAPSPSHADELLGLRAAEEKKIYFWNESPRLAGSGFVDVLKDLLKLLK